MPAVAGGGGGCVVEPDVDERHDCDNRTPADCQDGTCAECPVYPVPHEHHDALVEAYLTIVIERLMLDGPDHADSLERLRRVKGLVCP